MISNEFNLDIKKISLAHEHVLDRRNGCDYLHGRRQYGFVYVLSGEGEYRFTTGEKIGVKKGDVLFLFPNASYYIMVEKSFGHYTVNFDIHEDSSAFGTDSAPFRFLRTENTERLEVAFTNLVRTWEQKNGGYEMRAIGHLYELAALFFFDPAGNAHNTAYRLLHAKEHIDRHFSREITLEHLASISNMSITNFRREWKRVYGNSPMQYRDNLRIYYAKEYLASGYYSVLKVAEKCGFSDVSYFVRFFKKKTGMTPNEFKKQACYQ